MKKITFERLKSILKEGRGTTRRPLIANESRRLRRLPSRRGRIVREGTVDGAIEAEVVDDTPVAGAETANVDVEAIKAAVKELASAVGLELCDADETITAEPAEEPEEIVPVEDDVPAVSERRQRLMEARRRAMIRRRRMARR